jgi:predicted outer membrane repeat protein
LQRNFKGNLSMNVITLRQRQLGMAVSFALAAGLAHAGATITVNSADDDAASTFCNLRNAIASAVNGASTANCVGQVTGAYADPDTIQFAAGFANTTITLSQGAFVIDGVAIDLVGSGQTIDAGGLSPVFSIANNSTFSASGVTLTGGHSATDGGAIHVGGGSALTLSNSTVAKSYSATYGGGLTVSAGASLTLNASTVSSNSAHTRGGGIYAKNATLSIANSIITGNHADDDGGGIYGYGGAATIDMTTISNNTATGKGGGVIGGHTATLSLGQSIVSGNSGKRAGGIYVCYSSSGTLRKSTIAGNTALCQSNAFCGGGIYVYASTIDVIDSTISGNASQGSNNYQAGGAYVFDSTATFVNSTISANTVMGNSYLSGGLWELHRTVDSGSLTLINSTVANNSAASYNNGTYVTGGMAAGISPKDPSYTGALTLANTIVSTNTPAAQEVLVSASVALDTSYSLFGTALDVGPFNDAANHNVFSDAPGLGALANNGGPTRTMALLAGSPALRAGSAALAVFNSVPLYFDQRGANYTRNFSGTVDIGAYQDQGDRIFANEFESEP